MAAPSLRIVVPRFGDAIVGGSEGLARRLASALGARGWDVEVWSTTAVDEATWSGDLALNEHGTGYVVRRFRVAARRPPGPFHQATRVFFRLPGTARPESLWLRGQGPYAPSLVRALARAETRPTLFTPYLYYPTVYGLPAAPHPRLLIHAAHDERPLRLASVGRAIAAADALWYGTPEERDLVELVHPRASAIPHAIGTVGIDGPRGDAARFRARFGLDDPLLFYGGRAAPGKGVDLLLEAHSLIRAQHPELRLVVAGTDLPPLPEGTVATGRLDDDAWHDALAAAFAVIIPSTMESLSLLALDAWTEARPCLVNAGSPVLAGQVGRSGGGVTFEGAADLAAQVDALLTRPAVADRMGDAGRAYVETNHRWEDVVERLAALIEGRQP